ncbi:hypothetical protein CH352_12905 [Leptospira hartskeerlii]|uniref:Uncharacterized protein n=1 Tax=Leptospira hartskeerlii TaxID=2023177 RepID=A0A2M9XAX3_9LEPT|nr:hypothetical protein CH357_13975 [Leptospira hartskeerlii]PJZ33215.1 hypothetical protein CH352_12905 [Leptospira hartskeerlii]
MSHPTTFLREGPAPGQTRGVFLSQTDGNVSSFSLPGWEKVLHFRLEYYVTYWGVFQLRQLIPDFFSPSPIKSFAKYMFVLFYFV